MNQQNSKGKWRKFNIGGKKKGEKDDREIKVTNESYIDLLQKLASAGRNAKP